MARSGAIIGGAVVGGVAIAGATLLLMRRASAAERAKADDKPEAPGESAIVGGAVHHEADGASPEVPQPPMGPAATPTPAEVNALGRVIVSELGKGRLIERVAIAYAVVNRARSRGLTIQALESPGGVWGQQLGARPFSSDQKSTGRARELAAWVLEHPRGLEKDGKDADAIAGEVLAADLQASDDERTELAAWMLKRAGEDPTGGAWAEWEPGLQDEFTARGILYRAGGGRTNDPKPAGTHPELWRFRAYTKSAATVSADWTQGGQRSLGMIGRIELWSAPSKRRAA